MQGVHLGLGSKREVQEPKEGSWKFLGISENGCIYCVMTSIHVLCKSSLFYILQFVEIMAHGRMKCDPMGLTNWKRREGVSKKLWNPKRLWNNLCTPDKILLIGPVRLLTDLRWTQIKHACGFAMKHFLHAFSQKCLLPSFVLCRQKQFQYKFAAVIKQSSERKGDLVWSHQAWPKGSLSLMVPAHCQIKELQTCCKACSCKLSGLALGSAWSQCPKGGLLALQQHQH